MTTPLPNYEEWMWDAKCKGQDNKLWFSEGVSKREAQMRCSGCPFAVKQKCAQRALYYQDVAVIVAGVPLRSARDYNERNGLYQELREIVAGEGPKGKATRTKGVARVANDAITSPGPEVLMMDGYEYMSQGAASSAMDLSYSHFKRLLRDGVMQLTERRVRISVSGPKSVYYLADEIRRAKEKRDAERPERDRRRAANARGAGRDRGLLPRRAEKALAQSS